MDLGIKGKVALVCASTAGLGRATAQALAAEGATVVITGRRAEAASQVAAGLPGAYGLGTDLTQPSAAGELADAVLARSGQIDILVLNGPGPRPGPAAELTAEAAADAFALLVTTQIGLVQRALPGMRERRWGRIVAIGSSGIVAPLPHLVASNLGRAALAGYLKTLAGEVAADGVTVNIAVPGSIATDRIESLSAAQAAARGISAEQVKAEAQARIPAGRYGRPAEFGAAAAFLCGEPAGYITGTMIRCDGGAVPVL